MKVNVLGTEYNIIMNAEIKNYPILKNSSGYTDTSIKEIVIGKFVADDMSVEDGDSCIRKTLRHELIHAFMYESGLDSNSDWARNEELVDWIAIQFEKILKIFNSVNAIRKED